MSHGEKEMAGSFKGRQPELKAPEPAPNWMEAILAFSQFPSPLNSEDEQLFLDEKKNKKAEDVQAEGQTEGAGR